VQRTGDRVKISIQLIYASTDTYLWARTYERELTDVLKLQGDVARAVADEIRVQVTAEERARMASAVWVDPVAHQEYLVGRYHLWRYNEDNLKDAIAHFERATEFDPKYAAAHAGLSHAWWARGVYGQVDTHVAAPSRAAARKALRLDSYLAEAYVVQADLKRLYDWDWIGSENSVKRALALDPNDVHAHYTYALILCQLGRFDEAIGAHGNRRPARSAGASNSNELRANSLSRVQPRRIGRREMQMDVWVVQENVRTACVLWVERLSAIT